MSLSAHSASTHLAAGTFLAGIVLGLSGALLALLWWPACSRVDGTARRWEQGLSTALFVLQVVGTTIVFVLSEHLVSHSTAPLLLFLVLTCAYASRLLVNLWLVYHIHRQRLIRRKWWRFAFVVVTTVLAIVGGSVNVDAIHQGIVMRNGGELHVQVESFFGRAFSWLVLVIFLFIFVRARYNRIVGGVVGLLALLQGAAVVTAFINETWDWVLRVPITNLYLVMLLLVLLTSSNRSFLQNSNTRDSLANLSTLSKTPRLDLRGLEHTREEGSRWSLDSTDRRKGFRLKGRWSYAGTSEGHARGTTSLGSSGEECGAVACFSSSSPPAGRPILRTTTTEPVLIIKNPSPSHETSPIASPSATFLNDPDRFGDPFGDAYPSPSLRRILPQPTATEDELLPSSSHPRTNRRRSASYPPLPLFPTLPPRVQSRRSATDPFANAMATRSMEDGLLPLAYSMAPVRGGGVGFGEDEIGLAG